MTQSFDDFAKKHATERENQVRLAQEAPAEWEILKGLVSQFALDGKEIGSQAFVWTRTLTGRPMLTLGNVAAVLYDGNHRRVSFSRAPASSGRAYPDDSPLDEVAWELEPEIAKGEFVWFVAELAPGRYTAGQVADEIAKKLARYHIEYEKAFNRNA